MKADDAGHAGGQAAGEVFDPTTRDAMVSEQVTRITLLRHGEVEELGERRVRGQFDAALSARGTGQHARLAAWLMASGQVPDAVLTSDLARCSELAERLRIGSDAPLASDERLREQHMGDWQGRTWREIQAEDSAGATACYIG